MPQKATDAGGCARVQLWAAVGRDTMDVEEEQALGTLEVVSTVEDEDTRTTERLAEQYTCCNLRTDASIPASG